MARRELGPATSRVVHAVRTHLDAALSEPLPAGRAASPRPPGAVVVGVSGGADSLALAAAVAHLVRRGHLTLPARAVVVDHRLQPGSAEVAARAAAQVRGLGLPSEVVPVTVDQGRDGPEAAARAARYRVLLADRDALVLVAHSRDDQAETVLLGLARGSGTRSLAGMATRQGRLLRPLLDTPRADTQAVCVELGLDPWHDPHNDDPRFARVRTRALLPLLEEALGPGVAGSLARTAALCRDDADLLDQLAAALLREAADGHAVRVLPLAGAHRAVRTRALLLWLRREGSDDVAAVHVAEVERLVTAWHGQAAVAVPALQVSRDGEVLRAARPG